MTNEAASQPEPITAKGFNLDGMVDGLAVCGTCGAKQTIRVLPKYAKDSFPMTCDKCREEQEAQEETAEAARVKAHREETWGRACPPLYLNTDPMRLNQDRLAEVLAWEYGAGGLLLVGPTDTGKTRCAYLLLKRLWDAGRNVEMFDCAAFGHEVGRRFRDGGGEDWTDSLAHTEVVFLDDLGKVPFTERAEAELFTLIERRCANMLPLIVTSNMTGQELARKATVDRGAPMVRRLREFCRVVVFTPATQQNPGGGR